MLADEMGDKNAKRVMNLGQYNKESASGASDSSSGAKTTDHQDEGFLKSMWHNISGQHKDSDGKPTEDPKKKDEKK
jgi:molecular chaperone DnaJ